MESIVMKSQNMNSMSAGELLKLQTDVSTALTRKANELRKELAQLDGKPLWQARSRKVAPKYRGPKGELWSGRGLKPRWLAAEIRRGKKVESFAIR
jgi:DNA-binding protein H-NS